MTDSKETTLEKKVEEVEGTSNEQPGIEVDWEKVSLEDIKERKGGYLRQSDYTKKTQEVATMRKELESKISEANQPKIEETDDVKAAREFLKNEGVVTKSDLENLQKAQEAEFKFREMLDINPNLSTHEQAIRDLQKATWEAYEDVITKYWFSNSDKLSKAKQANKTLVWGSDKESGEKSIADMTESEYDAYRKREGFDMGGTFS